MYLKKLSLALIVGGMAAALAAPVASADPLAMDGQWHAFDVDEVSAASGGLEWIDLNGDALGFSFTGPATLKVVDGGFGGDRFVVYDNGIQLGETSAGANTYPASTATNFDAAFASHGSYSYGVYQLGAGNHNITGLLSASAVDGVGAPFNATVGAVQLAPVPEPETYAMMLAGLGLLGAFARRRFN